MLLILSLVCHLVFEIVVIIIIVVVVVVQSGSRSEENCFIIAVGFFCVWQAN